MTTEVATLNPALEDFWITPARNRVLYGGRSSSKSWDAAGFAIFLANKYRLRFLCARQIQNKIEESVYTLLKTQIYRFGLQANFTVLKNKIVNNKTGSEFIFYGLWRHIEEIKSLEGVDVCWIEEAHSLTKKQWEILEPTVRKDYSQFWIIFNPDLMSDFVYQNFIVNPPPDTIARKINYLENPFLSETILKVIEAKKEKDYEDYAHVYLGEPRTDDDAAIIKRSWISSAVDAHLKLGFEPIGGVVIGYDVADAGEDKNATVTASGSVLTSIEEWRGGEDKLLDSCTKVYRQAMGIGASIIYDAIGVGASAGAKFKELNELPENRRLKDVKYSKFVAGAGVANPNTEYEPDVLNKDMFSNLKAQAWWDVARRLKNTKDAIENGTKYKPEDLISISSSIGDLYIEQLKNELSTPRQDRDATSRVKVESKKDLKKRGIDSPNVADAAIMALSPHLIKEQVTSIFDL